MSPQLSGPGLIVITNCTTRKRGALPPISLPSRRSPESLAATASRWGGILKRAPHQTKVADLYVGRAISEAKSAARALKADIYVVSAGLGLVHEADLVPNYDLTVSVQAGALFEAMRRSGSGPADWWTLLTGDDVTSTGTLAGLLTTRPHRRAFIALPATYLDLIRDDLSSIGPALANKLLVFTSEAGRALIPGNLRPYVMPYDERLEGLDSHDGTRSDFPQRCLKHFVEVLGGHQLSLEAAHVAVCNSLAELERKVLPIREKRTDAQIRALLHSKWRAHRGSSTRLLRYLRDEALTKCEQGRFRALWSQVQVERQSREFADYAA